MLTIVVANVNNMEPYCSYQTYQITIQILLVGIPIVAGIYSRITSTNCILIPITYLLDTSLCSNYNS